jgi:hypothetical protein
MGRAYVLLVVMVSISFVAGVTYSKASAQSLSQTRSIDDAMLLMISSHTMIEADDHLEQSSLTKSGRMQMINSGVGDRTLTVNEIAVYRDALRESCLTGKALITARYAGEDECIRLGMMEKECGKRTDWLNEQAEALERARRRRARYRGIGGMFNRIGDAIRRARPGQAIRWFGKEVIPEVAKAALTGGVELKGRALQHFGRKVLQKKIQRAVQYEIVRRHTSKQAAVASEESLDSIVMRASKGWTLSSAEIQEIKKRCEGDSKESQTESTSSDMCAGDYSWINEYWEIVKQLLIEEGRNCQPTAVHEYRRCLESKAVEGLCKDAAIEACIMVFASIPSNDAGGTVTMTGETIYSGAVANEVTITYPSGGGSVNGRLYYQLYDDVFLCTITTTTDVVGEYDLETCTMRGTATLEIHYEGMTCVSVCGPTENSPAPCPVRVSGSTVWEATLEDGVLSGAVGDETCDPHCFGFRAPPYGTNP